jgi:hypothetical protein
VVRSYLPMATEMGEVTGVDYYRVEFFLGWWSLLFSQEWWGHIRYEVCGSLAVCHWRELGRIYIFWAVIDDLRYPGYKTPTLGDSGVSLSWSSWVARVCQASPSVALAHL